MAVDGGIVGVHSWGGSKLIEDAEKSGCEIRSAARVERLLTGIHFKDGEPVLDDLPVQQQLARLTHQAQAGSPWSGLVKEISAVPTDNPCVC